MARFITGNTFGTTDTVTSTTLNNAVNNAKISTDSVDNVTIEVNSDALRLKDSSSKTTGVTFAKMQHISTAQVLGRLSASEGDVEEVGVVIGGSGDAGVLFDNDDMLDNSDTAGGSATRGATQQSIKAYVDASSTDGFTPTASASDTKSVTLPNGLIMKFGRVVASGSTTTTINFSDFGGNFTNDIFSVVLTPERSGGETNPTRLNAAPSTSSFVIKNHLSGDTDVDFIAIGR